MQLADVRPLPWSRPVATFMANGQFYYIDVYRWVSRVFFLHLLRGFQAIHQHLCVFHDHSFPDEALLKRLTPDDVPEGHKEDEDDD